MQKYVIALYIRLSIEDYKYDSLSIENQSLVLHEYAASMPEALNAEIMEFIDNGYSGTNFERPQVLLLRRTSCVPIANAPSMSATQKSCRKVCAAHFCLPPAALTR